MKKIFKEIWQLALPYQDKRDDQGHAKTVLKYAFKLLKTEKADKDIVIPTAILHDIGWSQLTKKERFFVYKNKITKEMEMKMKSKVGVRVKHELAGERLAREILEKIKYNKKKIKKIRAIIKQHDIDKISISPEDCLVKDADRLWVFSKLGFEADIKRFNFSPAKCYNILVKNLNLPNYFKTKSAKKIGKQELEKRRKELKTFLNKD
ncbi:HD domain-containing protein [Patescibacteria group bacterium]|nr:HD domain-containing protein [Patescibacteria group bacterium]